ncbi:MAG: aspartate aminotransferase family protein [Sinobacterium sp.]|nr:aspartate aminotransferase family protein [Sinobacterium sp.]
MTNSNQTSSHIMHTYGRLPVEFVSGQGTQLFDTNGKAYLDAISGIGVCALGHAHPDVTAAITEQAQTLIHTSNIYHIGSQTKLADKLCAISGMDTVFFGNSGAEANEAAIKIARLHGHQQGIDEPAIIVFDQSFHGRTIATLTASGNPKIQAGFGPLLGGFIRAPYNNLNSIKELTGNKNIVAVLVEPIQGEGGLNTPDANFLQGLRDICTANNWLLMLDEVQTGNGRTGKYFAYQHHNILPDVVSTAKGLGNGVPIGACLAKGNAAQLMQPGSHGSTYGGNPLVCSAALATVTALVDGGVIENAATQAEYFKHSLETKLAPLNNVADIRTAGLMIGIELTHDCTEFVAAALEQGLLINVTANKVIRLLPPLIIQPHEIDQIIDVLASLIKAANTEAESA